MAALATETKRTLDTLVPLLGGAFVFWMLYRENKKLNEAALIGMVAAGALWLITRNVTTTLEKVANAPGKATVIDSTTPSGFDPTALATRLHADIHAYGLRDTGVYKLLNALGDSDLVAVYNKYNRMYAITDGEGMITAMLSETYGWDWLYNVAADSEAIIARLRAQKGITE